MSENNNVPAQESAVSNNPNSDEFKNLKAEMNRKLENTNLQIQQLIAELKSSKAPSPQIEASGGKKVSVFDDEEAYARTIEERTEKRIEEKLNRQREKDVKYQTTVQTLMTDFPEVNDTSSELMKRATEIYTSLSEDEKSSPLAMKTAVHGAAAELGIKPKSKRSASSDDNFSMSGSNNSSSSRRSGRNDLDNNTLDFAQIMGLNINDPKVKERLKNRKVNIIR